MLGGREGRYPPRAGPEAAAERARESRFAARFFGLRRRRHGEPTQGPAARREARRGAGRAWPDLAGEERRTVAGAGAGSGALDARARGRGAVREVPGAAVGVQRGGLRDRKSVVSGTRVSVRVDLGGRRIIKKTTTPHYHRLN